MKNFKLGYTFVELLLTLVFFFLILASVMPMISKRHLQPPEKANHGFYACVATENDNQFREIYIKGSHFMKDADNGDRLMDGNYITTECKFTPPSKSKYFYVQIIGAGGAGHQLKNWKPDTDAYEYSPSTATVYVDSSNSSSDSWSDIRAEEFKVLLKMFNNSGGKIKLFDTSGSGSDCSFDKSKSDQCGSGSYDDDAKNAQCSKTSGPSTCPNTRDVADDDTCEFNDGCTYQRLTKKQEHWCLIAPQSSPLYPSNPEVGALKSETCTPDNQSNHGAGVYGAHLIDLYYGLKVSPIYEYGYSNSKGFATGWPWNASLKPSIFKLAESGIGYGFDWHDESGSSHRMKIYGGSGSPISTQDQYENCQPTSYYSIYSPQNGFCEIDGKPVDCGSSSYNSYHVSYDRFNVEQDIAEQTQSLSYGYGGGAGEIKTMILRKFPTENVVFKPGKSANNDGAGSKSCLTLNGKENCAAGGHGPGTSSFKSSKVKMTNYVTNHSDISPTSKASSKEGSGRAGTNSSFQNFIRFILTNKIRTQMKEQNTPVDLEILGKGGNGAYVETDCPLAYSNFTMAFYNGYNSIFDENFSNSGQPSEFFNRACNGHSWNGSTSNFNSYWHDSLKRIQDAKPNPGAGAIFISW